MKKIILKSKYLFGALAILLQIACVDDEGDPVATPTSNLTLVFEDNFEGAAGESINTEFWNFDIGTGSNGWGNQELQYYTDRPENVSLDGNGNMVITAKRENFQGSQFTSARITTKNKVEQQYGRFEGRIQMPGGRGIWPAFWMLGNNIETSPDDDPTTIQWPFVGEIDITELRGQEPSITNGSLHGPGYSGGGAITSSYVLEDDRFDADFHIYAVEWTPDYIDFYLDDIRYQRISRGDIPQDGDWVFDDHPFFLLLNVAVGGTFVGFPVDDTPLPQTMVVDYVRVYSFND